MFAASLDVAKVRAEKKVSTYDKEAKRPLTESEWRERVALEATNIFGRMKPVRVSPEFDAPQFAKEFCSLAEKTYADAITNMKVMRIGEKIDAKGNPVISKTTGQPQLTWVPFDA
nr:hypothetical protein [Paraburkholderia sp. BL8N3]